MPVDISVQTVMLVLVGAAVFVLGASRFKSCLKMKKPGTLIWGKVLNGKLIEKRDPEKRLIQHYYEVTVQYCENGKNINCKIKSTVEYLKGDEIRLIKDENTLVHLAGENVSAGMAAAIALAGMALAVFPVMYQSIGEQEGSAVLAVFLILAGGICFASFAKDRRRGLVEIAGEIVDVLYSRKGENKRFSKATESYYPLIKCTINEKDRLFLAGINSSLKNAYKPGKPVKLYYDQKTRSIVEKKTSPALAAAAVLLWMLALLGILSIL